jgi:hypothetical protein
MRRLWLFATTALLVVVTSALFAATAAAKPKITSITGTTNTEWTTSGGGGALVVEGSVGLWTGGFGDEPAGDDTLSVEMSVHGEGGVSLNYQIQTTDIVIFDWFSASLTTPSGEVPLVSNYNPNPNLFELFVGPVESLSVDLTPYRGQTVTLHLTSHQDGFGDQFQTLITNLTTFGLD